MVCPINKVHDLAIGHANLWYNKKVMFGNMQTSKLQNTMMYVKAHVVLHVCLQIMFYISFKYRTITTKLTI